MYLKWHFTEWSISGIWVALPYLNDVGSLICIKYDLSLCLSVLIVKARQTARSGDKWLRPCRHVNVETLRWGSSVIGDGACEQKEEEENKGIVRLVEMSRMGMMLSGWQQQMDHLSVSLLLSSVQRSGLLSVCESVQANRSENCSGLKEQQEALKRLPDHLKRTTNKAEGRGRERKKSGKDGRMKIIWQKRDDESCFQKCNLVEIREYKGWLHRLDMKIFLDLRLMKRSTWRRFDMKVERMRHTETTWRLQVEEYCLMSCDGLQSDRYTSVVEESLPPCSGYTKII